MPTHEIRRFTCAYNPAHGVFEERFFDRGHRVLFPDGRRINWQQVCRECRHMRADWEEQRDIERFREAEEARQRRLERSETREARQRETDLAKLANIEAQIGMMLKSREAFEAQMALLVASRDKLRKKYFQPDDKNT